MLIVSRSRYFCLIVFFLLGSYTAPAQNADIDLLRSINMGRNKAYDGTLLVITNSVYPVASVVPVTELITGYASHNKYLIVNGWQTVAGLALNTALTFGLKTVVNRPRPFISYPYIQHYQPDIDPSFPSGHTSFSFCTATSLSLCFRRWYVVVPAYMWAAGVGYSRMALGMHYPSDVLTGAVVGFGSSWLVYKGNQWLHRDRNKNDYPEPL